MAVVAVVGATGCVGRHFCAAFTAAGDTVVAIARRYAPSVAGYRFLPLDVAGRASEDTAAVLRREGVDVVVNATGGWGLTEEEMRRAPVRLVDRLLGAVARLPNRPRFVHVGTIHEYGRVASGTSVREDDEPDPQTLYARTKLAESRRILDAVRRGEVDGIVLRLANTIGPDPAMESFFGALAARLGTPEAATGIELTIADARRDYVDVRDAAAAVVLAARVRRADPLVNVGRGQAVGIATLVSALVRAAGLAPDTVRERQGVVPSKGADWTQLDISRARRLLGWRPRYSLDESMRAMWDTVSGAVAHR